jgi:hypothetical protein
VTFPPYPVIAQADARCRPMQSGPARRTHAGRGCGLLVVHAEHHVAVGPGGGGGGVPQRDDDQHRRGYKSASGHGPDD